MGKGRTLVKGTLLLTASGLALRGIGVLFHGILVRRMGAEGLGVLQLILTVGGFAGTLGSAGVRVAALQLTARAWGRGDRAGAAGALAACLRYGLLVSAGAGAALALLAGPLGTLLLRDPRTAPALRVLGLLLPLPILTSVHRAALTACGRVRELVAVDFAERLVSGALTLLLLELAGEDPARLCAAVVAGSYGAAGFSLAVLRWKTREDRPGPVILSLALSKAEGAAKHPFSPGRVRVGRPPHPVLRATFPSRGRLCGRQGAVLTGGGGARRRRAHTVRPYKGAAKPSVPVAPTALPLGVNDALRSGLGAVEQFLIPYGLEQTGTRETALAAYGTVSGLVFPLLWFPGEVLFAMNELMVSETARLLARRDRQRLKALIRKCLGLTTLYALGVGTLLWLGGGLLGRAIYQSETAGRYLQIFAPMVLFLYPDAVVDGLQKGLGQQLHLVRYNTFTNVIDVLGLWLLLPRFGMGGYIFTYCLSHLVNLFLSFRRLLIAVDEAAP